VSIEASYKAYITEAYVYLYHGSDYGHQARDRLRTSPEEILPRKMVATAKCRLGTTSAPLELVLSFTYAPSIKITRNQ